jgi:(p)ppGpp synthase/HD superfamily hydrolase
MSSKLQGDVAQQHDFTSDGLSTHGNVIRSREIAIRAHAGQFRRTGDPYWFHLKEVARRVKGDDLAMEVAWLHDVLEDTDESPESLHQKGVSTKVIQTVQLLTRKSSIPYDDYLLEISCNELARRVKIADMLHNLSDLPSERQVVKYEHGLRLLLGGSRVESI